MDDYEMNRMQDAWDANGWGTVPSGLCQNCVNEYWRVNIKDKPKEQPNTNPTPNPDLIKSFIKAGAGS